MSKAERVLGKFQQLRNDQAHLKESMGAVEAETGKTRQEMIGDVSLAGEGLIGWFFDLIGFNDGIPGYHDEG